MPLPRPQPRVRSPLVLASLALLAAASGVTPAQAQPRAQVEDHPIEIELVAQSVSLRPGDPLGIRLRVLNSGLEALDGYTLSVAVHSRTSSRSALHASFEGNPGLVAGATSITHDDPVPAGAETTIDIDLGTDELPGLASATEGGVYPLTLTLGVGGVPLDALTTPLVYYPEPPETPLNLSLVLPVNDVFSRGPSGDFEPGLDGILPLEAAVAPGGWLTGLVEALAATAGELPPTVKRVPRPPGPQGRRRPPREVEVQTPSVHLGIAPTPRLIEELADMADGYTRRSDDGSEQIRSGEETATAARAALVGLANLLTEDGIQPLAVPYSFPDLPALTRNLPAERTSLELSEGAEVASGELGVDQSTWLFPPAGRIDGATLGGLQRGGVRFSLFNADAIETEADVVEEGCPEAFASFTCLVTVRTSEGPVEGLVTDRGLQERLAELARGGDERLDLQRFFAETAAIRQELPSVAGRVAQATIPSLWHPRPQMARLLLEGLREAPWLRTVTPAEAMELEGVETRARPLVSQMPPLLDEPTPGYFDEIEEAAETVSSFELVRPPVDLARRLSRNTVAAQSRLWWTDPALVARGAAFAGGTLEEARQEMGKLTLGTPNEIRLTSQQGEVPIVVFNETGYPATVDLRITSQQLDLHLTPSLIEDRRIEPNSTNQFTIQARTTTSGIFPLEIRLETPDGLVVSSKVVRVSSTEFNEIALGVTIGAFCFLVLFYVMRAIRRRRERREETADA